MGTKAESKLKVGFNTHRLKEDDPYYKKECDFVKAINDEINANPNALNEIVNHAKSSYYLNENEEKVALSVIQWLGTPIGQAFLEKVRKM